jgi:acetyl-CoA acyltransferase 2
MVFKQAIYIVAARRTPFGKYGGKLKDYTATQLQEFANRAVLKQINLPPEAINSTIVGNVTQTSTYAIMLARHAALAAGIPIPVPSFIVNRLCGSGFQAIVNGGQDIVVGESDIVLCGGTENMSQSPYAIRGTRFGTKLGESIELEDTLWAPLTDGYCNTTMSMTGN